MPLAPAAVRQSLCTGLLASPKRVLLLRDAGQSIERNSGYSGLKFIRTVFQYIFGRGAIFVPPGVPINTRPETGVAVDPIYRELFRTSPATLTADTVSSTSQR